MDLILNNVMFISARTNYTYFSYLECTTSNYIVVALNSAAQNTHFQNTNCDMLCDKICKGWDRADICHQTMRSLYI